MWKERLLVVLLASVLYARALGFEFVWDDHDLIETNAAVRAPGAVGRWPALLSSGFASSPFSAQPGPYYRPLTIWTLAVDHALSGPGPRGFHRTNVLLHAAAALAVLELLATLGYGTLPRLAGAALFAVHPVHAEPVLWISGRTDLLAACLVLVSFIAYRRAREGDRARAWFAVTFLGAYGLGLLAKEVALALPLLAGAYEFARHTSGRHTSGRHTSGRTPARRLGRPGMGAVPLVAGLLLVSAGYLALRARAIAQVDPATPAPPLAERMLAVPFLVAKAVALLVWPARLDPVHAAVDLHSPVDPRFWIPLAVILGAGVAFFRRRALRRTWLEPALFFLITLLPVLGLVPLVIPFAERFLYLPSVALAWIAAEGVSRGIMVTQPLRRMTAIALAIVLTAATVRTWMATPLWRDDATLFGAIVARHPDSVPALSELAIVSAKRGDFERARDLLTRATGLAPDFAPAHFNLARVLEKLGDRDGAAREFERTLELAPTAPGVAERLVRLLRESGRDAEAIAALEKARSQGSEEARALLETIRDEPR